MNSADPGAMFDQYHTEFTEICGRLDAKVAANDGDMASEIDEATKLMQDMELEARTLPSDERKAAKEKIKKGKTKLEAYQRAALMDGAGGAGAGGNREESIFRMKEATAKAAHGNKVLEDSIKRLGEVEEIGQEISTQLEENHAKIEGTQGKVKFVDGQLGGAKQILNRMTQRAKHFWKS